MQHFFLCAFRRKLDEGELDSARIHYASSETSTSMVMSMATSTTASVRYRGLLGCVKMERGRQHVSSSETRDVRVRVNGDDGIVVDGRIRVAIWYMRACVLIVRPWIRATTETTNSRSFDAKMFASGERTMGGRWRKCHADVKWFRRASRATRA